MEKNIKNISTAHSKSAYDEVADTIAQKYSDYAIIVDGGSYRPYNVWYEVDHMAKTIKLDYYLPLYTNFHSCNEWVLGEIAKGHTRGSTGLGFKRPIMFLAGVKNVYDEFMN